MLALFLALTFLPFIRALDFTVNTPQSNAVQTCEIVTFDWLETSGPYELSVILNTTSDGEPITTSAELDYTNRTCSYWNVNVEAGTSLFFILSDHIMGTSESAIYTVQAGSDSSCVGVEDAAVPADYSCSLAGVSSVSKGSSLSSGAKAGIIVGSVLGLVIVVLMVVVSIHYYNRRKRVAASTQWASTVGGKVVDGKPIKLEDFGYGQFATADAGVVKTPGVDGVQQPRRPHVRQNSLSVVPVKVEGKY